MKIKVLGKDNAYGSVKRQICYNREMPIEDIDDYLSNSYSHINSPLAFGEDLLKAGAKMLVSAISAEQDAIVIVDSDCDGMTSSALLINYLYSIFPAWTQNHLSWVLHAGKQHGLADHKEMLLNSKYSLVIAPDSSTNDTEIIDELFENGKKTLILDHHLSDVPMSKNAVIINSQYNYPNPQLSGAGVVWQFCRYLDKILLKDNAIDFVDLAAIGMNNIVLIYLFH